MEVESKVKISNIMLNNNEKLFAFFNKVVYNIFGLNK